MVCFSNTVRAIVIMIVWEFDLQLPMQSVAISTKVVSLNPHHVEVYSIQTYVMFVSGFLWVIWFPPPIKLTATI